MLFLHSSRRLRHYVAEGGSNTEGYDAAVHRAESFFNAGEDYNLFGNNCHQFAAHAMNLMAYDGRRNWNMVHLAVGFAGDTPSPPP